MQVDAQAMAVAAAGTIYAGTERGVFRSTDRGAHWTLHTTGFPGQTSANGASFVLSVAVAPAHPEIVFAGTSDGLAKSTDGGLTWSAVTEVPQSVQSVVFDPGDPDRVLAGTSNGLFRGTDGGATWERLGGDANPALGLTGAISQVLRHPARPGTIYVSELVNESPAVTRALPGAPRKARRRRRSGAYVEETQRREG